MIFPPHARMGAYWRNGPLCRFLYASCHMQVRQSTYDKSSSRCKTPNLNPAMSTSFPVPERIPESTGRRKSQPTPYLLSPTPYTIPTPTKLHKLPRAPLSPLPSSSSPASPNPQVSPRESTTKRERRVTNPESNPSPPRPEPYAGGAPTSRFGAMTSRSEIAARGALWLTPLLRVRWA